MDAVIYVRVSTSNQDYERQIINLKKIATEKKWNVKRIFNEKISGTIDSQKRGEFKKMLKYTEENNVDVIMISELSRLGRRVVDVLNTVDVIHNKNIALYIDQLQMISIENGTINSTVMLLLQMMSIGAEMENNLRKERQKQGIQVAKINGVYKGRKEGARESKDKFLHKHQDVVELINNSTLSLRKISLLTKKSINTVRKVQKILL